VKWHTKKDGKIVDGFDGRDILCADSDGNGSGNNQIKSNMRTTQKEKDFILSALSRLGIDATTANQLRRISLTLQRWAEMECGTDWGHIERDETTGKPFHVRQYRAMGGAWKTSRRVIADREAGALRRLAKIMAGFPGLLAYHQGDCRGAALYILRAEQVRPGESIDSVYSRGIAVY